MIIIPGWLVAVATFPGIIVHEAAHMLFCRLRGLAVLEVCFLQFRQPVGYVIHESAKDFTSHFLVCVGPFIINTLLCFVLCFPAFLRVRVFEMGDVLSYVLLWCGISIGMHAYPSNQDGASLWHAAKESAKRFNVLAMVSFPVVIVIYLANLLSIVWFAYLYGFAVGLLLPELLLKQVV